MVLWILSTECPNVHMVRAISTFKPSTQIWKHLTTKGMNILLRQDSTSTRGIEGQTPLVSCKLLVCIQSYNVYVKNLSKLYS